MKKFLVMALDWVNNGRKTTLHDWQKIRIASINRYEVQTNNYDKDDDTYDFI